MTRRRSLFHDLTDQGKYDALYGRGDKPMTDQTYQRVIPRDLFNEAKLLKCLGRLAVIDTHNYYAFRVIHDGKPFQIEQDQSSGDLYCLNVKVRVCIDANGEVIGENVEHPTLNLYTPANSRADWPLMFTNHEGEDCPVFRDDDPRGNPSPEFLRHMGETD